MVLVLNLRTGGNVMDFYDKDFVLKMDCISLILKMKGLSSDERGRVLNIPFIREKLRKELLISCNFGDVYKNFSQVLGVLSIDDIAMILDYKSIYDSYKKLSSGDFPDYDEAYKSKNFELISRYDAEIEKSIRRNDLEYLFFSCLFEFDADKAMEFFLSDDDLFGEVMKLVDKLYSCFSLLSYDAFLKVILKLDEMGFDRISSDKFKFVSYVSDDYLKRLLDEDISDDMLTFIIPYFDKEAGSCFFLNDKRAIYLYRKISSIMKFVKSGVMFNEEILRQNDFFDMLKSESFVEFRSNVNALEKYNYPFITLGRLDKYYTQLISEYDSSCSLFKKYRDILNNPNLIDEKYDFIYDRNVRYLFYRACTVDSNGNKYFSDKDSLLKELKRITSLKISEIVVDMIFADNIYNVWLNIKEMLRYNDKLSSLDKVLDDERVLFYKMILDIDNRSSGEKVSLFKKLLGKNFSTIFYDDLRRLKDVAYDFIKEDLIDLSKCDDMISTTSSEKYGTTIYDFRDSKYTMLVRKQLPYRQVSYSRRSCFSIISELNSDTYSNGGTILYGYNSFENDRVIHMLEQDAFSDDVTTTDNVSRFVNRIMTSNELVNGSYWYSEVELVNLRGNDGKFISKKPDFIVTYDRVRDSDVAESKRLRIPIVIIKRNRLKDDNMIPTDFDKRYSIYVSNSVEERSVKEHIRK